MLVKNFDTVAGGYPPAIRKVFYSSDSSKGRDASREGAFSADGKLNIIVDASRRLGVSSVSLNIAPDGKEEREIPLDFTSSELGIDTFEVTLSLAELCENGDNGLFYYSISVNIGDRKLYTNTCNNVDYNFENEPKNKFRLLVFSPTFNVPRWLGSNIIYHIFVDRFANSNILGNMCDDIAKDVYRDWVPQFAEIPGGDVANDKFFGGDIEGILKKIDYLTSLGVGTVYLSPIFESPSNHRYDTSDYEHVDARIGGDASLIKLISFLEKKGMKVILDGVFNHTGSDSKYFDKFGKHTALGAYQSADSPYYDWFNFRNFPDEYECWWNIDIMPRLDHSNIRCRRFFTGERGIGAKYAELGIGGWRLDVADELNDDFLNEFRRSVKHASNNEAVIIGEVWENAADKISYGKRREYLRGYQLDSVMNYPIRTAIIDFVMNRDGRQLYNTLTEIYSSYPRIVADSLMNLLGTHDTERILTVLSGAGTDSMSNPELSSFRLNEMQKRVAKQRLKVASIIQYTVYGTPSLYYGDEVGLEGGRDPFCRLPYPWGDEDTELLDHYVKLGNIRKKHSAFDGGDFTVNDYGDGKFVYTRSNSKERIMIIANSSDRPFSVDIGGKCIDLLNGKRFSGRVEISPISARILKMQK